MGMSDRQFDAYRAELLENLRTALAASPENEILRKMVERIDAELRRP